MNIKIVSLVFCFLQCNLYKMIAQPCLSTGGITTCLLVNGCDPDSITGIDASIYSGECSIGLNRFLSRSSFANGLMHFNYNADISADTCECEPPYNHIPETDYCPEVYCDMINSFLELDIQLIQRAYWGAAFHEHQFYPNDPWYETGEQMVKDINYSYDCAGKIRPIIGAMVFEVVDSNNFQHAGPAHNYIPSWLITKYFEEYPEDSLVHGNYYFEGPGVPKDSLAFNKNRIGFSVLETDGPRFNYNIHLVEMRMWFLYQAWTLIDMGYKHIHMGIYQAYCKHDTGFAKLYKLTGEIREYAEENSTFVILSGEPTEHASAFVGSSDTLIFDFDSRAMRPREVSLQDSFEVSGDSAPGGGPCDEPISPAEIIDLKFSPCSEEPYLAVVDPCTIDSHGGTEGGISPLGCYVEFPPYTVHFDGFRNDPSSFGEPSDGNNSLTFGWHDNQWFAMLSPECQRWWFDYYYCDRRKYHNENGFIVIPGIMLYDSDLDTANEGAKWLISDDSLFIDMLKNQTLQPDTPYLIIAELECETIECSFDCNGVADRYYKYDVGPMCYDISIGNQDCSSTYSIHIKDPNGNWLPQTLSPSTTICPIIAGSYTIIIRQDNMALPIDSLGTSQFYENHYLLPVCCDGPFLGECEGPIPSNINPNTQSQTNRVVVSSSSDSIANSILKPIDKCKLYPTLANDHINIQAFDKDPINLYIHNSYGILQSQKEFSYSYNNNVYQIDIKELSPGYYTCTILTQNFIANKSFIKIE